MDVILNFCLFYLDYFQNCYGPVYTNTDQPSYLCSSQILGSTKGLSIYYFNLVNDIYTNECYPCITKRFLCLIPVWNEAILLQRLLLL